MAAGRLEARRLALKKELQRRGRRLRGGIWEELVRTHVVDLVAHGQVGLEHLTEIYLRKEEDLQPQRLARREVLRDVKAKGARGRALSEMLARRLRTACGVDAFRDEVLAGKLLSAEELPGWIEAQAAREAPVSDSEAAVSAPPRAPLDWLFAPDAATHAQWLAARAKGAHAAPSLPLSGEPPVLEYAVAAGRPGSTAIRPGGALAQLKSVAADLCASTGCSEQAAVSFALCGVVPALPKARLTVHHGVYPAADRIELMVTAGMSPKKVAALYREAGREGRGARVPALDKKHVALALLADRARESGRGWKKLRRRWNWDHPAWRYKPAKDPRARRFAREAKRAWTHITGERWRDPRGAESLVQQ
jgi:hypothetical protein